PRSCRVRHRPHPAAENRRKTMIGSHKPMPLVAAAIALAFSLATSSAAPAHADTGPALHNQATPRDGRSPDTKDAALAARQQTFTPADGRSPDTRDAAQAVQARLPSPLDGRSPDTRDAAALAHTPVVIVSQSPSFDWGAFGIGIAVAAGIMLLLGVP